MFISASFKTLIIIILHIIIITSIIVVVVIFLLDGQKVVEAGEGKDG